MSNQEVKVGQVWERNAYGYRVKVSDVEMDSLGFITLKYIESNGNIHEIKERKDSFYSRFHLVSNEPADSKEDTTSLRDHFAGLAMHSIVVARLADYEDIAAESYKISDAMLKARGE